MTAHYFTQTPQSDATPHEITVSLGGGSHTLQAAAGVFSTGGVDRGTAVLLEHLPHPPAGHVLDIGCGWGAISLDAALREPGSTVWALDVNERALELTAANAAALHLTNVRAVSAAQVPGDIQFAQIRSNPPIRVGKAVLHDLMHTWVPRLAVGGDAYFVVAKSLGAPSFEKWLSTEFADTAEVERIGRNKGFHVIRLQKHS